MVNQFIPFCRIRIVANTNNIVNTNENKCQRIPKISLNLPKTLSEILAIKYIFFAYKNLLINKNKLQTADLFKNVELIYWLI